MQVHQKVLLVQGQIGDPEQQAIDGNLLVNHHQDSFPSTLWPVSDSHFKALVHLNPGRNRLRFDFSSPKLQSSASSAPAHSIWFNINFLPMISSPPLQLVILLGKDSPATFDAVPERKRKEGNGLDTAVRKYRMAAYIWQAFTGEQMFRNGFGRRCFRFEEEWQTGSLTARDIEIGQMRNEAKVHVVRSEKTVKELRDLDLAQQYDKATRKGELFTIARDAVKAYFQPMKGQKQYVSVLLLDAHWDNKAKVITSHAALGGRSDDIDLAIFGSQALQSYPSCIEDVPYAFTDCTRTDCNHVANDCNESGSNWEAANIGIGAHLHEVGHLLGCPHQESGVMLRDYVRFNRTFVCREPYSTRTKSPGLRSWTQEEECNWHRLDVLRFRHHSCFRLPTDMPLSSDTGVQVWPIDSGRILVTAQAGVAFLELYIDGEDTCHVWKEFVSGDADPRGPPQQVCLADSDIKNMLPEQKRSKKITVKVHSAGGGDHTVSDYGQLIKSKDSMIKLSNGQPGFRGSKLGFSQQAGTESQQVLLQSSMKQTVVLRSIKIYHGFALDGIEFCYENSTSELFGKKGGQPGGSEFHFGTYQESIIASTKLICSDIRKSETLMGFYVRAGLWIDGIEILTSLGRRSGVYGNPKGGSGYVSQRSPQTLDH